MIPAITYPSGQTPARAGQKPAGVNINEVGHRCRAARGGCNMKNLGTTVGVLVGLSVLIWMMWVYAGQPIWMYVAHGRSAGLGNVGCRWFYRLRALRISVDGA
jgi:hypothetical protein